MSDKHGYLDSYSFNDNALIKSIFQLAPLISSSKVNDHNFSIQLGLSNQQIRGDITYNGTNRKSKKSYLD